MTRDDLTRLSVNMNSETADALSTYASERGVTITEAVRRAISLLDFMERARHEGERIFIESANRNTTREVVIL